MKRINNESQILKLIEKNHIGQFFATPNLKFSAFRYQKREFLNDPGRDDQYLQFIVNGSVSVYFIREDGSRHSLEYSEEMLLLGEMAFVSPPLTPFQFYAEAVTEVISVALPLTPWRTALHHDTIFLNYLVNVLSKKLTLLANYEAVSLPLEERVLNHMKCYCRDGVLRGVEQTAFRLHCSDRHLQRVLNRLEAEKLIQKCAKGTYRLL